MKYKKQLLKTLTAFAFANASLHGAVLFDLNISWAGASTNQSGTHSSGVVFSTSATANSGLAIAEGLGANTDIALGSITWSDGTFSGVVDVEFAVSATGLPTSTLNASPIRRGGRGAVGIRSNTGTDTVLGTDEGSLTISNLVITKVSGDDFTFDGFTGIYLGNAGFDGLNNETAETNGSVTDNFTNGGSTQAAGFNSVPGFANSLELVATEGEFSLNGVQIQITGIPEPSSSSLLGLGFIGLILHRRR